MALGAAWGRAARAGWVIGLSGDLGAGKTCLVKGIAQGLDVTEPILSPTFALVHQYTSGRMPLYHLDLYRLESVAQIVAAGLEEFLWQRDGVTVVEWITRWGQEANRAQPGAGYRQVTLSTVNERERKIDYDDFGG